MTRALIRLAIAAALVGAGWAAGQAQTSEPDFEVIVDAPVGETTIECARGCALALVERGLNPSSVPMQKFTFKCTSVSRCSSRRVGGWIKR